jgi:N-acetylmuramoyl-L-alanine amidase
MAKKKLKYLIIHCSATPEGRIVDAATIKKWHTSPPPAGRGWKKVGYSDLVLIDGKRHKFVSHNGDQWVDAEEITNGVAGVNSVSRHVCYIGGMDAKAMKPKNTLTAAQGVTLRSIIEEVLAYAPDILIAGHNQFDTKACPSFWVPDYLRSIGVPQKNIYTADPYNYAK